MLPERDREYLAAEGLDVEVTADGGMICVLLKNYELPEGYTPRRTDLLLRLSPGYPEAAPDMYWCDPVVSLARGGEPEASQVRENYFGRTWQRFSRHLAPGHWRPGIDGLQNYLCLIRRDLIEHA